MTETLLIRVDEDSIRGHDIQLPIVSMSPFGTIIIVHENTEMTIYKQDSNGNWIVDRRNGVVDRRKADK